MIAGLEQKISIPVKEIVVQTPKRFFETMRDAREVSAFPRYRLTDAIVSDEPKYTLCANTCSILAMSNGKQTYLGHFAPDLPQRNFKERLEYEVKKMQDETGQLTAFVTGGYDSRIYPGMEKSFTQIAEIGEVLDKAGTNVSMIAGKRKMRFLDNLAVNNDSFILSHNTGFHGQEAIPELRECKNRLELENALNNYYGVVEIEPEHHIRFKA